MGAMRARGRRTSVARAGGSAARRRRRADARSTALSRARGRRSRASIASIAFAVVVIDRRARAAGERRGETRAAAAKRLGGATARRSRGRRASWRPWCDGTDARPG